MAGVRCGYVEAVAARTDRRRRVHGAALMEALEQVVRGAYALAASGEGAELYVVRGWQLCRGPTSALTPTGIEHTEEHDEGIYVLPVAARLDLSDELTCDWRDGDVCDTDAPTPAPGPDRTSGLATCTCAEPAGLPLVTQRRSCLLERRALCRRALSGKAS